jgi:hypothetical protein
VVITTGFGSARRRSGVIGQSSSSTVSRFSSSASSRKIPCGHGLIGPDLYVPISRLILPISTSAGSPSSASSRARPEATIGEAQPAIAARTSLERAYPIATRERTAGERFSGGTMQFRGHAGAVLSVGGLLLASVGLVLVIACVNVTGLLMARAATRRSEIAIRVALGAGRRRVAQAMLIESFLLVITGAAVGLPLAFALSRVPWPGVMGPLQGAMALDGTLLAFAFALIVASTLVCGLIPALKATHGAVVTEIQQNGGGATARLWLRHALVVGQVAMSLMLIVVALLCVRSQAYIGSVDQGFDIDHGVVARFSLDPSSYPLGARPLCRARHGASRASPRRDFCQRGQRGAARWGFAAKELHSRGPANRCPDRDRLRSGSAPATFSRWPFRFCEGETSTSQTLQTHLQWRSSTRYLRRHISRGRT